MDWGNCKDILVFLEQKEGKYDDGQAESEAESKKLTVRINYPVIQYKIAEHTSGTISKGAL